MHFALYLLRKVCCLKIPYSIAREEAAIEMIEVETIQTGEKHKFFLV